MIEDALQLFYCYGIDSPLSFSLEKEKVFAYPDFLHARTQLAPYFTVVRMVGLDDRSCVMWKKWVFVQEIASQGITLYYKSPFFFARWCKDVLMAKWVWKEKVELQILRDLFYQLKFAHPTKCFLYLFSCKIKHPLSRRHLGPIPQPPTHRTVQAWGKVLNILPPSGGLTLAK